MNDQLLEILKNGWVETKEQAELFEDMSNDCNISECNYGDARVNLANGSAEVYYKEIINKDESVAKIDYPQKIRFYNINGNEVKGFDYLNF